MKNVYFALEVPPCPAQALEFLKNYFKFFFFDPTAQYVGS